MLFSKKIHQSLLECDDVRVVFDNILTKNFNNCVREYVYPSS